MVRSKSNLFGFGDKKKQFLKRRPGVRVRSGMFGSKRVTTFEASNAIKEIAQDQGYQDGKRDEDRDLSPDEVLEYFSGPRDSEAWVQVLGKQRAVSVYKHAYAVGRKRGQTERSKREKSEQRQERKDITDLIDLYKATGRKENPTMKGYKLVGSYDVRSTAEKVSRIQKPSKIVAKGKKFEVWRKNPGKGAFERCVKAVTAKGGAVSPRGVCAAAGRKKYGAKKFAEMAKAGKRAAQRNPIKVSTMRQGKATAVISIVSPGKYRVRITKGNETLEETLKGYAAASTFARVRLHEVAHNPSMKGIGKYAKRATKAVARAIHWTVAKARKNPVSTAEKTYEEFHGMPSEEIIEYQTQHHYHSVTASIGKLVCLQLVDVNGKPFDIVCDGFTWVGPKSELKQGAKMSRTSGWDFNPSTPVEDIVMLTTSEDGRQVFIQGGDQNVDTKALGLTERDEHDHMLLGTIWRVWYRTKKKFESDGAETDFFHAFGKEGSDGVCPVLNYKPRNPSLEVSGGRYYIAPPEAELGDASPGIVG